MVAPRTHTPPSGMPRLVLCADGGGSKVCVVIRSEDGLEVRGTAGPCNVVGYEPAIQRILLATYRALSQLPQSHLPPGFILPELEAENVKLAVSTPPRNGTTNGHTNGKLVMPQPLPAHMSGLNSIGVSIPSSPYVSRANTPRAPPLPPISTPIFSYIWLALAGISTPADSRAFMPYTTRNLGTSESRVKITNDVNLLAAPALKLPGIQHVAAVVCGTGTVGRTIKVEQPMNVDGEAKPRSAIRSLPLEDVGVSRGWGYVLCDEGSAFWLGRLAIRSLIRTSDRIASSPIFSAAPPARLPLHTDLLAYFGTHDPMDLIGIVSLTGPFVEGLSIGEATAKRNAFMAGAARVVFKWAFPEDGHMLPPSPPITDDPHAEEDPVIASHTEALKLVQSAIKSLIELTLDLLGDGTVVSPTSTALALGGGLWNSKGYRNLLQEGLQKEGVVFRETLVVSDAAGAGAQGLANVEFGN